MKREEFILDEHLKYLEGLKASDVTDEYSIKSLLMNQFPKLSIIRAILIAEYWQSVRLQATSDMEGKDDLVV